MITKNPTTTYRITTTSRHGRRLSRIIRAAVNEVGSPTPIWMVDGSDAPQIAGSSYYHTTLSGKTEVRYPGAYGWPTLYHASTRRIVVGREWVVKNVYA